MTTFPGKKPGQRFLAYTTQDTLPLISDHPGEALAAYQAGHEVNFEPGRLV